LNLNALLGLILPDQQGRIQEFTRGEAQTCHGSWGAQIIALWQQTITSQLCLAVNFYHSYLCEVFKIGTKPSNDFNTVIILEALRLISMQGDTFKLC